MGRNKYSVEERDTILRSFIRCTKEIMETEGVEHVSTRKLASLTGYISAKLYFYFKNIDDLIAMASVGYTEKYCRALAADMSRLTNAYEFAVHAWDIFCRCAFDEPALYYRLFFGKRETPLQELVDEYYRLYPAQLEKMDPSVREFMMNGDLSKRTMITLRRLLAEGIVVEDKLPVVNELMVSYFKSLLEERMEGNGSLIQAEELKDRFMKAFCLLIESAKKA